LKLLNYIDKKIVEKTPKLIRKLAPIIALAMLWFDVSILFLNTLLVKFLNFDVQYSEISIRILLYVVIIIYAPRQLKKIWKAFVK